MQEYKALRDFSLHRVSSNWILIVQAENTWIVFMRSFLMGQISTNNQSRSKQITYCLDRYSLWDIEWCRKSREIMAKHGVRVRHTFVHSGIAIGFLTMSTVWQLKGRKSDDDNTEARIEGVILQSDSPLIYSHIDVGKTKIARDWFLAPGWGPEAAVIMTLRFTLLQSFQSLSQPRPVRWRSKLRFLGDMLMSNARQDQRIL